MLGQLLMGLESAKEQTWLEGDEHRAAPHRDPGTASPAPAPAQHMPSSTKSCFTCLCSCWSRGDREDLEEDRTVTQTPCQRGSHSPCSICAGAIARLVLAEVVPSCSHSTFCFLLKQGHCNDISIDLQCQEYLGSLPTKSSLPARPPAVGKFTGNRIYSTY